MTDPAVEDAAQRLNRALAKERKVLSSDELHSLKNWRCRLEKEFPKFQAYFFSIDGDLNGTHHNGMLFAGCCVLVFAIGFEQALKLANDGVKETIALLDHEFDTRNQRELSIMEQGMDVQDGGFAQTGGRRSHGASPKEGPGVEQKMKMTAMIRHIFGGEPWRW